MKQKGQINPGTPALPALLFILLVILFAFLTGIFGITQEWFTVFAPAFVIALFIPLFVGLLEGSSLMQKLKKYAKRGNK